MSVSPIAICSRIGASILVLLVAACGGDPTVAPAPIAVTQVEVQPSATTAATAPPEVPTATTIPTPTAEPTATPLPTPTLAPTATATPRLSAGIVPHTPTPLPPPTPTPDLDQLSQNRPPHIFVGAVTIDGLPAPEGTVVRAWINGVEVASAQVEDGRYLPLAILIPGQTVTFMVGDLTAAETFFTEVGGVNVLNLTAARQARGWQQLGL